jgi:CoA:oxalate CoA-transferase
MIVSATSETGATFRMPGNPVKLSAYDDPATRKAAPRQDQDRDAILAWLEQEPDME